VDFLSLHEIFLIEYHGGGLTPTRRVFLGKIDMYAKQNYVKLQKLTSISQSNKWYHNQLSGKQ
jgi:hypothetical protein